MTSQLVQLQRRRAELVARAEAQRREISAVFGAWQRPLRVLEWGRRAVRFVKSHPVLVAAVVAALIASRRSDLGTWVRRAWLGWRIYRSVGLLGRLTR